MGRRPRRRRLLAPKRREVQRRRLPAKTREVPRGDTTIEPLSAGTAPIARRGWVADTLYECVGTQSCSKEMLAVFFKGPNSVK